MKLHDCCYKMIAIAIKNIIIILDCLLMYIIWLDYVKIWMPLQPIEFLLLCYSLQFMYCIIV